MHHFPFHIGDWMSHTSHLSPEEKAAYLAMIIEEYLHEKPLPDDIDKIARKINMRSHCECIAVVLQEFYERIEGGDGGWSNKRVRAEIEAYKSKSDKARASANARWNKAKPKDNANALRTQSEGNANHKPRTKNHIIKPDEVSDQTWSDFLAHRKKLKADLTETALKGIVRETNKAGWKLEDALTECVARGWRGFKSDWVEQKQNRMDWE
jgi:uncharacterized protein YdaU (DUF1376 family)